MTAAEVRNTFLKFFESKGHSIVPSAPIVVKNDPTLMFTNAGMNQFKDWFLGNEPAKYKRVVDTQKCLRVSGKHNDLEEVGVDTYHHTMFEMLGNWSFGDYFKKEAIEWAWELLTEVYKLPKDRLYVTVFEGDAKEGLAFDQEAFDNWKLWIDESRILNGNKKDNFWEMGDTGPCGPCTEIHIDLRPDAERKTVDGKILVNNDHPQVIEIWNNVFMEFNRKADGSLEKLPAQHVDTGMGFERLVRAIEGKTSNYDTDVFVPTIQFIEKHSGVKYAFSDSKQDIAMRVMADHIRAISFAIADGQLPSNNGAGYVIRRILRRAVRYQYQFLNVKEPFMCKLAEIIADSFKNVFPELYAQKEFVVKVIREEEVSFLKTLERGISRLQTYFHLDESHVELYESSDKKISGEASFELFDTYGFPIDLTKLIASENGFTIDENGFEEELQKQKARSRKATELTTDDWVVIGEENPTVFLGYDQVEAEVSIIKYRKVKAKGKESYQLVFNQTPFYPEGGGQVGDIGKLIMNNEELRIVDTKKENNLIIHFSDSLPSEMEGTFKAVVDVTKRRLTEANHSATHLLHAALRSVLGTHVQQKGSLVNNEYLRFDFSHFAAMTADEIAQVEHIVNQKVRENISLDERRNVPIAEAQTMGAMMLFGEKYGESVRVITFDDKYSRELCGGTHVKATGQIGYFKITAESAVAAGVRRIEAITADGAEAYVFDLQHTVTGIKNLLSTTDLVKSVNQLMEDKAELLKKLEVFENEKTVQLKGTLKSEIRNSNGINSLIAKVEISSAEQLKNLSFQLKGEIENIFCVLGCVLNGKPMLSVIISDNLVADKKLHAGNIVKDLAKEIQGGGGGQPFYATAGGNNVNGLQAALDKAKILV
ncbi:alanyl-tRNA synthetase [Bacteroidetes bacterium UKL13-3]|nr:alanyl-tRNA synthetase [Bacteroidetes bacterium UKL13-3]HCP94277.1 alanine--tRNA ligase [Bacteroidota bacterium]